MLLALRCWWHSFREHSMLDSAPAGDGRVLCNCSCGGYAQVEFLDVWPAMSKGIVVHFATCPMYVRYMRRGGMPSARLLSTKAVKP